MHVALPVSFLNFPASQAVHGPPSGPLVPAPHLNEQSEILVLASGEFGRSSGQDEQFADPGASLYVPMLHALHLPGDESEFAGHTRQVDGSAVLKEAIKPDATLRRSEVNTTCMYPVFDV